MNPSDKACRNDAARATALGFHQIVDKVSILSNWQMMDTVSTRISGRAIHFPLEAPSERTYLYKTTQNASCINIYTSSRTFPIGA